jgi:hypothetical protein
MWYKLNDAIGIILLVAVVGGASVYGLTKVFTGPPLLRQNHQEIDARKNPYTRGIMKEHDRRMQEIQEQHSRALKDAADFSRRIQSP